MAATGKSTHDKSVSNFIGEWNGLLTDRFPAPKTLEFPPCAGALLLALIHTWLFRLRFRG